MLLEQYVREESFLRLLQEEDFLVHRYNSVICELEHIEGCDNDEHCAWLREKYRDKIANTKFEIENSKVQLERVRDDIRRYVETKLAISPICDR